MQNPSQKSNLHSLTGEPVATSPSTMNQINPNPATDTIGVGGTIPPTEQMNTSFESHDVPKKGRALKILFVLLLVVVLLFGATFGAAAMVAYGMISTGNKEWDNRISIAVQSLPLMPKRADFLILKSMDVNNVVESGVLNLSISAKSVSGSAWDGMLPGMDSINFKLVGPFISDIESETYEIDFNIDIEPGFASTLRVKDEMLYFRINSIDSILQAILTSNAVPDELYSPLLNRWISYDLTELESEAKSLLDEDSAERDDELEERFRMAVLSSSFVDKMVVTEEELDGYPVHKISLNLTGAELEQLIDEISRVVEPETYARSLSDGSVSDAVDDFRIGIWLDSTDFFVRQVSVSFRLSESGIDPPSSVLGVSTAQMFSNQFGQVSPTASNNQIDFAMVLKISDIGVKPDIQAPSDAITVEDLIEELINNWSNPGISSYPELDDDMNGFQSLPNQPSQMPQGFDVPEEVPGNDYYGIAP